jgi:DUF1009 family protein
VLRAARQLGHDVVVVAIKDEAFPALETLGAQLGGTSFNWISLGQLGRCISTLKDAGVVQAVMAGQVKHVKLFTDVMPDATMMLMLAKLATKNTDSLISAIAGVLAKHGIDLIDSTAFLADLLAKPGVLSERAPTQAMTDDFTFGYTVADAIAGLDVGQTIVVKDKAVVAVEAMEGTDAVIARAGTLAGAGTRSVKVAKPAQDMRFDVPVVGIATVEAMAASGADAITVDAGKTLIVDGERFFRAANAAGIVVIGRPR